MIEYQLMDDPINQRIILNELVNKQVQRKVIVNQNDEQKIKELFEVWNEKNRQKVVSFMEKNVIIKFGIS